jgi:hypothetical protein
MIAIWVTEDSHFKNLYMASTASILIRALPEEPSY